MEWNEVRGRGWCIEGAYLLVNDSSETTEETLSGDSGGLSVADVYVREML